MLQPEITCDIPASPAKIARGYSVFVPDPGEGVPDCAAPVPTVTMTPESSATPVTQAPPKEAPPTTTTQAPPGDEKPPITVTETPPPQGVDVPDLGLAKTEKSVVNLVLTGVQTGTAYERAAVKLLMDEPPLRVGNARERALRSIKAYASDGPAAYTGKDGRATFTKGGATPTADAQSKEKPGANERRAEVRIDESKKARLVVTMRVDKAVGSAAHKEAPSSRSAWPSQGWTSASPIPSASVSTRSSSPAWRRPGSRTSNAPWRRPRASIPSRRIPAAGKRLWTMVDDGAC